MIFEYHGHVVTLDDPAQYPLRDRKEKVQAKERSAASVLHTESFEVEIKSRTYVFQEMRTTDYNKLFDFFDNYADGMLNEYKLTDDLGDTNIVKFTEPVLNFELVEFDLWAGSFSVEVVG